MKDDNIQVGNEMTDKSKLVSLSELDTSVKKAGKSLINGYSIVSDVKVNLEALVGNANLTIQELFALNIGAVVELNESVDTPLILMLDGKPVASGVLVVVGENFGVRITEILKSSTTVA